MNTVLDFARRHPRLVAWLVLAVGFVALLYWQAPRNTLQPSQMAFLTGATVLTAGLCAWIVYWE